MLCFSDQETREGPRGVSQAKIYATCYTEWAINNIRAASLK
jgi:hypothetical protein